MKYINEIYEKDNNNLLSPLGPHVTSRVVFISISTPIKKALAS